jgi:hypothetical protein
MTYTPVYHVTYLFGMRAMANVRPVDHGTVQ